MAVLHRATLSPSKAEAVTRWLDTRTWGGSGPVEMIGGYRFDDPAGEVGVESLLVRRGERVLQVPLTYRGAALAGAEDQLVTLMEHSALGRRWVYHAAGDPVAIDCFTRALRGELGQAVLEIQETDGSLSTVEPPVRVVVQGTAPADGRLRFTDDLADPVTGAAVLRADWDGGSGVVAALG